MCECRFCCMFSIVFVLLLARPAEPLWQQKHEHKQNKNSECAVHFLAVFFAVTANWCCQTWLKWQCDCHLINDDRRDSEVPIKRLIYPPSLNISYQIYTPPPPPTLFTWLYNVHSPVELFYSLSNQKELVPVYMEKSCSGLEGSCPYPSYPGWANFSLICLQNVSSYLHKKLENKKLARLKGDLCSQVPLIHC